MKHRFLSAMILLATPVAALAQDGNALILAKDTLDRGAALFDTRDAAAMAATYVEDAEIILIKRDSDTNRISVETRRGRAAIEKGYADIFKDRLPEHRSRNTVETARFLGRDLLLVKGRFALNRDQGDSVEFVQIRAREGDQWKVVTMQLMELPK
jgi:ketosteroid isomerase-like protein